MIPMMSRTSRIKPRQIKAAQNQGLLFRLAFFVLSSSSSERRLSTGVWRRLLMLAKLAWKSQSYRTNANMCEKLFLLSSIRFEGLCTTHLQSTSNTVGQVHRNCAFCPKTNSLTSRPPSLLVVAVGEDKPSLWNVAHLAPGTPESLLLTWSSQGKSKILVGFS